MKRIYWESMKKWAVRTGIVGVSGFALLFMYLSFLGVIEVTGYSGDVICEGTINDPCLAYINFTAKEDIFLYPLGYDPWGRDTPFSTDLELESWKMYRSWGTGWREIKLDQTCTGTWCGAPNSDGVAYSFVFREDRDYQIKIEALKKNPDDIIKWGFGPVDPVWYSDDQELNKLEYSEENKKVSIKNVLDEEIADLEITSHINVTEIKKIYSLGFQEVFKGEGYGRKDYEDILTGTRFENMKNNEYEELNYYWEKAISWGDVEVNNPQIEECGENIYTAGNNSWAEDCYLVNNGTHLENQVLGWERLENNKLNLLDNEFFEIRLMVDIIRGGHYDLTFEIAGKRINEWAEWENPIKEFLVIHHLQDAGADARGLMIMPTQPGGMNITNITVNPYADDCTTVYIRNSSAYSQINTQASIVSFVAHFGDFILEKDVEYYIVTEGGCKVKGNSTNPSADPAYFPSARINFNITGGTSGNGGKQATQYMWQIDYITSETEAPPPSINYSVALPLDLIRFLNCGPDITNPHSQPDGQTSVIATINATNNGTGTTTFTINLTGTLNTGWTIRASKDNFANNLTLSTTAQTIWSSVGVDETKKIWLAATCNNVVVNPGESIDMQAV